jgi:predicted PurR-regulated permease PerM
MKYQGRMGLMQITTNTDAPALATQDAPVAENATVSVQSSPGANSLALQLLAIVALIFLLDWAQSFFISLLLGILISYTLSPLVNGLERIKIPRLIGVSVVMLALVGGIVFGTYSLRGQVQSIITELPEAASKFSKSIADMRRGQKTTMRQVQLAASEMEKAAAVASVTVPQRTAVTHVVIDPPKFRLESFLWASSIGALAFIGETLMVLFLAFFLLLSGDIFKRKLVKLTGPSLSRKKITVHILEDINHSIQKYMFMLLVTNVMVGMMSWLLFRWLGLENAGAWAVTTGMLHLIPYFGPVLTAAATGMAAYMQFDSFLMMLSVAGGSLLIATFVGIFVTTWMTGRIAKMNSSAVFISLLFWAWLWGVWGMLLSIPVIVIIKVVSEHIEQLESVAELLGE